MVWLELVSVHLRSKETEEMQDGGHVMIVFFSSRRRHTRYWRDWSSDVCSSDLEHAERLLAVLELGALVLALDHHPRGFVGEADGSLVLLDVLPARALGEGVLPVQEIGRASCRERV